MHDAVGFSLCIIFGQINIFPFRLDKVFMFMPVILKLSIMLVHFSFEELRFLPCLCSE